MRTEKRGFVPWLLDMVTRKSGQMRWRGLGGGRAGISLNDLGIRGSELTIQGTGADLSRQVGQITRTSVASICLQRIRGALMEPEMIVETLQGEKWVRDRTHPAMAHLRAPNPYMGLDTVICAAVEDVIVHGNGYILKSVPDPRSRLPFDLYHLDARYMVPRWQSDDGSAFVDYWEHRVGTGAPVRYEVEDVCHMRDNASPEEPRLGASRLTGQFGFVATDSAAQEFTLSTVKNFAIPSLMVSPASPDVEIPPERAESILQMIRTRTGGAERGGAMVFSDAMKLEKMAFSPQEVAVADIMKVCGARVAAAIGVPLLVAGFEAGLDAATYSNIAAANDMFTQQCLGPLRRMITRQFGSFLLGMWAVAGEYRLAFCYDDVLSGEDVLEQRAKRAAAIFQGGVAKRGEARAIVGLASSDKDDEFMEPPQKPFAGGQGQTQ